MAPSPSAEHQENLARSPSAEHQEAEHQEAEQQAEQHSAADKQFEAASNEQRQLHLKEYQRTKQVRRPLLTEAGQSDSGAESSAANRSDSDAESSAAKRARKIKSNRSQQD